MLLAVGLLLAPVSRAQTVDEILTKHYETMGGLEKIKALNTMRITGTMLVGPGMEAPITMERKRPGKRRLEFQIQGMTGVQAFDGEKAWSVMPFMGKKDPEAASEEDSKHEKDDADFDGPLVDWKAKGHAVELVGKEPVEGAEAYKLKITKKNGDIEYYYLDAETYLLVKNEGKVKRRGTEVEGEGTWSDYKDVNGYMMPFTMEQGIKGTPQKQRMTFSKIEINVPLDDARFAMPAVAAAADTSKAGAAKAADAKATETVKAADAKTTDATKATTAKATKGKKKKE
jgi:hypothetical protein